MFKRFSTLFCLIASLSVPVFAESFSGIVYQVIDGDTLEVRKFNKKHATIHLHGIDSPELKQLFGDEAHKFLSIAALQQHVKVFVKQKNEDGSYQATINLSKGQSLNELMVKTGMAWLDTQLTQRDRILENYEKNARNKKLGLWKAKAPIAPWDYRAEVTMSLNQE